MKKYLLILLVLKTTYTFALSASVGSHVPYFNQAQTSESGDTQKIDINPYFGLAGQFHFFGRHYLLPEFGYSYYLDNPTGSKRDVFFLHYNLGYVLRDTTLLRYGLTTHYYRVQGEGGRTTLRNGDDSQSFPNPNKTVTTHFTTLDLGVEQFFDHKQKSIRFDLNMMNFRDFDNLSLNYLLTANFYL